MRMIAIHNMRGHIVVQEPRDDLDAQEPRNEADQEDPGCFGRLHPGFEEVTQGGWEDAVQSGEDHDAEGEGHGGGEEDAAVLDAKGLPSRDVA